MDVIHFANHEELYMWHDAVNHYLICGDFTVKVDSTGEHLYPVFTVKQNGDIDGLEGWSHV